jgi:GntR family transcriptional regulator, transcriptional repressor for pyruvate dehydrogenase complex
MKQLKTKSLVQALIDEILDQIKHGALKPGDALPSQRQLVEQYDIGRSSVREALQALTLAKIIEVKPGKGAIISNLSFNSLINPAQAHFEMKNSELLDLLEARTILEIGAISLCVKRIKEDDISLLEEKFKYMEAELKNKNYESFVMGDFDFHRLIFSFTYNIVLMNIFDYTYKLLIKSISSTIKLNSAGKRAIDGHKKILEMIKDRNEKGALIAMRYHLDNVRKDLSDFIDSRIKEIEKE